MDIKKAIITAAGKTQRNLPLQTLVDRDGVTKTALRILIEEILASGIDEICVVICPGDQAAYAAAAVLELYRARWLIEMAIKRMKSLFGLGQLPKRADASARAWLHGKLFVALLVERLRAAGETLSPWGYPLACAAQPLA